MHTDCETVECLCIEDPHQVIELYERKQLKERVQEDYTPIRTMMEQRHKHLGKMTMLSATS